MSPKKRKTKADEDGRDTIYAADVDDTYQPYIPRATRSRGNPPQPPSPLKKRKLQPVAQDPRADDRHETSKEEDGTVIVTRSTRRRMARTQNATPEPQEQPEGASGNESEEAGGEESEASPGKDESGEGGRSQAEDEFEEERPSSARGNRRQLRLRTQFASSQSLKGPQSNDGSEELSSQQVSEFEEEVAPKTRKTRALPAEKKKPIAKKVSVQGNRGGKGVSDTSDVLEEFRVPLDRRWTNSNRFVALVNNGTISPPKNAKHDYKPVVSPRPARYVKDLPEQEGRKYVLVEKSVRLYTIRLDGKDVKVWRLEVRNTSVQGAQPFQIFRHPVMGNTQVNKKQVWTELWHHNPITQRLCDNRDEVIRLDGIYADLLNKTPMDFNDKSWDKLSYVTQIQRSGIQRMARVRRFVEQSSLLQWMPDVDFSMFHPYFINHPKGSAVMADQPDGAYGRAMPVPMNKNPRPSVLAKIYSIAFLHTSPSNSTHGITITVTIADVDVSTTGQQIDVPSGYTFANTFLAPDGPKKVGQYNMSDQQTRAAFRVAQWVHYRLNGMTGDEGQLKETIDSMVNQHVKQPKDRFSARSYNNQSLVCKPVLKRGKYVDISVSRPVARSLGISDKTMLPIVAIRSSNRISHAYVINQLLVALRVGKSLVHAVQEFFVAGDEINLGLHKIRDIKDTFCLCAPADRHNTEHPCMHCFRVLVCDELVRDNEGRTLCTACAGQTDLTDDRFSWKGMLISMVNNRSTWDKKKGTNPPTWDRAAVVNDLMRKHCIDDNTWKDGYDGEVSLLATRYTDVIRMGVSGRLFSHPKQPSLEKPLPMWFDEKDKKLYLHSAENVTLTQLCTNYGNYHTVPAMIAWDKVALLCMEYTQKRNEKPRVGYHASVEEQYAAYERAGDNIYAISTSYSHNSRHRTAAGSKYANSEAFEALKRQLKSGIFEGTVPRRAYTGRAEMRGYFRRLQTKEFVPWSPTQIKKLSGLLKVMESSPFFNPHGLKFPRSPDGSPWFWRPDHRPANADWEFINREFQARLWTMDDWCDEENETPETACTIFLFYAIFFLRTGGKCHIFGCIMTYASGHTAVYSIGRAVVILNNAGEFVREVVAGEAMRSGFSSLNPTDLEKDFDFANCTIMIESWRANALRSDFPGGLALIDTLKDTVRQRADRTEFYDHARIADRYAEIPPPGPYVRTNHRIWRLPSGLPYTDKNRLKELEDEEEDEYDDEEEDDDEDELDSFDNIEVDEEQRSDSENETSEGDGEESSEGGAAALEAGTSGEDEYTIRQAEGEESGNDGADALEGGTHGEDEYAIQQGEGAGAVAPAVEAAEDSNGNREPRRKVEISSNTMARLTPRDSNTTFVPNSVSDLHPMAGILIVTGIWPNTRLGYPTTDNSFTSTDGVVCGTFDDAGDIFDPELNFLGNIVAERYE